MRIVIDMQGAQTQSRLRGIGRYTMSLVEAILKKAPEHEYILIQNSQLPPLTKDARERLSLYISAENILTCASLPETAWWGPATSWSRYAAELSRELFLTDLAPDVVLLTSLFEGCSQCDSVSSICKWLPHIPTAVVFYDLIPLLNPDKYLITPSARAWYHERIENLKRADMLFSISAYASTEAMETLGLPQEKVISIGTAHNREVFKPVKMSEEDLATLKGRYSIEGEYLMYNGSLESRKNLEGLIRAYSLLNDQIKAAYQLVFVGFVSTEDKGRILSLARKQKCSDRLILTGHVDDTDLLYLFNNATLFVFPSKHEGFGLPALEAMACGTATIGSNVTSIPEVIGREDALFDPASPESIATSIEKVLLDDAFREDLQQYALKRADTFSWDAVAHRAVEALIELGLRAPQPQLSWEEFSNTHKGNYAKLIEMVASFEVCCDADLRAYAINLAQNVDVTFNRFRKQQPLPEKLNWRIEGPFDSSYSLALLNRETAIALHQAGHRVALHSTEGPGDFLPSQQFLQQHPLLEQLNQSCGQITPLSADVTSRNLYPPRVFDMESRYNMLHHFAWEETALPQEWVDHFNTYLQGITCLSSHVKKILIDNGVRVPLSVSGCGVDHWERIVPASDYKITARSFKFLHVSSCFPRKGVDILVDAYTQAFSAADDCTLVIKTFSNPHNAIKTLLEEKQESTTCPHILLIEQDLTEAQVKALYEQCHAMVVPSRAEGFALPLAEAILSGLDVITTGWSGQLDFCNPETAWLVDYAFSIADTHFNQFNSVWATPDTAHLARTMRNIYEMDVSEQGLKAQQGRALLLRNFRWQDVSARLVDAAQQLSANEQKPYPRVGWVTTWNTRCGIATYSAHLMDGIPESIHVLAAKANNSVAPQTDNVSRCWEAGDLDSLEELAEQVEKHDLDMLVIQFNYSLFNIESLGNFIDQQISRGKTVVMTLHSTKDPVGILPHKRLDKIKTSLARCQRLLVHSVKDLNRLKALDLVDNVTLFPLGVKEFDTQPSEKMHLIKNLHARWNIASYGFFLPHKGLIELIEACAILRKDGLDVCLSMVNSEYPFSESASTIKQARVKIAALQMEDYVTMETQFLPDNESFICLKQADMLVFPYQDTGESASGAVRYGLATDKPVVVTPIPIFEDIESVVFQLPGKTPAEIAAGIKQLITDISTTEEHVRTKLEKAQRWRHEHTYSRLGRRLCNMLFALHQAHKEN